jgi:UDP-N-acetyl-D-mannosaminuronic acid dehydrogenase
MGAEYYLHDPFVKDFDDEEISRDLDDVLSKSDCIVIVTAHTEYRKLEIYDLKQKMKGNLIIDGRNVFNRIECQENGFIYIGLGK